MNNSSIIAHSTEASTMRIILAAVFGCVAALSCADLATVPGPLPAEPALSTASAGDLVISEIMIAPQAVSHWDGEWFEVTNLSSASIDLQGWTIASRNDNDHVIASSVVIPAGGYAVLGKKDDASVNGGALVDYAYGGGIRFAQGSDDLVLRDPAGVTVDSIYWDRTMPAGRSRSVRDLENRQASVQHGSWYSATVTFGAGDRGTPGAPNDTARDGLYVHVIEAGQADAVYIESGGSRILYDAGQGMGRMEQLIYEFGLRGDTLDLMILSHAHFDHHGGMREFFKTEHDITIRYFVENGDPNTSIALGELRDSVEARVGRGETVFRHADDPCGDGRDLCTVTLDGGAKLHLMKPMPHGGLNERSVPVKLVAADSASFTMWLAGDAENETLAWFEEEARYHEHPGMDVDVLKGNHHGSCNGVTARFLQLVDPTWTTFGVSDTNGYGHVHEQTKALFRDLGYNWYRTDQNGRILFHAPSAGGYTVEIERGTMNMDGGGDDWAASSTCGSM